MISFTTLPDLIKTRQADLTLTDGDLARALSYPNPKVISMIKAGQMDLAVNKVSGLAYALQIDAKEVLRHVLAQRSPELFKALCDALDPLDLLPHEKNLIKHLRGVYGDGPLSPLVFEAKAIVALIAA